ncbi:MAG: hypothetical protein EOQ93_29350 [Mesorhizobium sp.]|nr:MAG: hypothetical protein EOQ93_29350 [Mesorhizobium sp.]
MTKTVLTNDMVAHVWAHQTQDYARTSNGNMHFDGPVLYSYSTPIANIVDGVALITTERYSITTSGKHMPGHRELSGVRSFFYVPFIGAWGGRSTYADRASSWPERHAANLAHLVKAYANQVASYKRMKSFWFANALDVAAYLEDHYAKEARRYADMFGLPLPVLNTMADADSIWQAKLARDTPEAIAKRQKEAAKRAERKAAREAEERRLAALAWIDGGSRRPYGGPVLLRVLTSGRDGAKHLETSLGATVPLDHAIKVFRFVKLCREQGREWHRNGHTLRVGHFQVDHVLPNGDFHAGCHFITWAETERLAGQLGLLDAAPSADGLEATHHAA